jgi:hypothetical protein
MYLVSGPIFVSLYTLGGWVAISGTWNVVKIQKLNDYAIQSTGGLFELKLSRT